MLPKKLVLKGFRSYIDTVINFDEFGNNFVVVGENGAGKSTILNAITTALYGINSSTDSKGSGLDKCINTNCDKFEIEFTFTMNNNEYLIIVRKQRGESKELEFYIDGVNQSEKVTETQEKINDVIKMNYDTLLDTICLGQGESSRFMMKKPIERKETLIQILDIQKYEKYEKEAKERKKQCKAEMSEIENQISFIESYVVNVVEKQAEIDKLQKDIDINIQPQLDNYKKKLEFINRKKIEYENLKKQYDFISKTRMNLKEKCISLQNSCDNIQEQISNIKFTNVDYESEIKNFQTKIEDIRNEITTVKEKLSEIKAKKDFTQKQLTDVTNKFNNLLDYNKSVCDLCGSIITEHNKEKHLHELCEQQSDFEYKISDFMEETNDLVSKGKQLSFDGKKLTEEKNMLELEKATNDNNKTKLQSLQNKLEFQTKELEDYKKQYEENMKIELIEVTEQNFDDKEVKQKITIFEQEINDSNEQIILLKETIKKSMENSIKIKELKDKLSQLKIDYSDYNSLSTTFGKSGIPSNIIEHDLPEIEEESNKILSLLSNDSMTMNFVTSKETASGKKSIDTLDIMVNDINGSRSYETFSGGEKFRIDFAVHIGLAKFLTKRSGATIDFLIIDEGLGSQDDMAKQKFVESIHLLNKIFKQIMVITHIPDLQNSFDKKVFVQKDPIKGSMVEAL